MSILTLGLTGASEAADPVVLDVRATQLADKTVEVLYDLSEAPPGVVVGVADGLESNSLGSTGRQVATSAACDAQNWAMSCNTTVTGTLDSSDCIAGVISNYYEWWTVDLVAGQTVIMQMTSGSFTPFFYFRGPEPNYTLLANSQDGSARTVTATETGTHWIQASSQGTLRAGNFTLSVQCPATAGPVVSNVRATQLADKTVEVLYDLSGAPTGGATVTVAFSENSGATYTITPAESALTGHVGAGVTNGTNRRLVWNASATLPPEFYKTTMRAAVTATDSGSGGQEITITLPGGVPLVLVRIPKGTFLMGSPSTERGRDSDETQHQVTLTQDYYLGKYEVTWAQWAAVMGSPSSTSCPYQYYSGYSSPVECVTWNEISGPGGFVEKLNQQQGTTKFRLPTEAEWERAARAETTTRFSHGDVLECDDWCGSCSTHDQYMWWCWNSGYDTQVYGIHPVGQKQANSYGLYDMHGNVWEWVQDWYGSYGSGSVTDPKGPGSGSGRVLRGGAYTMPVKECRSAVRFAIPPDLPNGALGFRLARSP